MASLFWNERRTRWTVAWYDVSGERREKNFRERRFARAFKTARECETSRRKAIETVEWTNREDRDALGYLTEAAFLRAAAGRRTRTSLPAPIRRQVWERDTGICQRCGLTARAALDVHHIDGDPNNHALDNLQLLCRICHAATRSKPNRPTT